MDKKKKKRVSSHSKPKRFSCAVCRIVRSESVVMQCTKDVCHFCLKSLAEKAIEGTHSTSVEATTRSASLHVGAKYLEVANAETSSQTSADYSMDSDINEMNNESSQSDIAALVHHLKIDTYDHEKVIKYSYCSEHHGKMKTVFCSDCAIIMCESCRMDHHLSHKSCSIEEAAESAKVELSDQRRRIRTVRINLENSLKKRQKNLKDFEVKTTVVKREILRRYSRIIDEAEKCRDDALADLNRTRTDAEDTLYKEQSEVKMKLRDARYFCEKITENLQTEDPCKILTLLTQIRSGNGREAAIKTLIELDPAIHLRSPVYRSELIDVTKKVKKFIGSYEVVTMPATVDDTDKHFAMKEKFCCGDEDDATVFCVKAERKGTVVVSFFPFCSNEKPLAKVVNKNDCQVQDFGDKQYSEYWGAISFTDYLNGFRFWNTTREFDFYAKNVKTDLTWSLSHSNTVSIILTNELKLHVRSMGFRESCKELFSIESKLCRAFDVDEGEKYLVVVEEPAVTTTQRKVLLYRRPDTNSTVTAVDTYTSPISPFQPADVCFYTLPGHQVLLIADETNDALHVAEVKDDRVTFTRFLCPSCPLLLQPTALNTDHEGRLWVGCRGGRIVTLQRKAEDDSDSSDDEELDDDWHA